VVKFTDLPAGSRFRYRGEVFEKRKENLALNARGVETLFPSHAEVTLVEVAAVAKKRGNSANEGI
jgi:hypothetical protein